MGNTARPMPQVRRAGMFPFHIAASNPTLQNHPGRPTTRTAARGQGFLRVSPKRIPNFLKTQILKIPDIRGCEMVDAGMQQCHPRSQIDDPPKIQARLREIPRPYSSRKRPDLCQNSPSFLPAQSVPLLLRHQGRSPPEFQGILPELMKSNPNSRVALHSAANLACRMNPTVQNQKLGATHSLKMLMRVG